MQLREAPLIEHAGHDRRLDRATGLFLVQAIVEAALQGEFADVVEHLIPELQRRGAFKKEYAPGTYREKLFGRGRRLEDNHPGAARRRTTAK